MDHFDWHIGIDYSGAKTATARLGGLQVFAARGGGAPQSVDCPACLRGRHRNWNRQEAAEWIIRQARSECRFIAGIDHGFSFPRSYFRRYGILSWCEFLNDFTRHWPTDQPNVSIDQLRKRAIGPPDRSGSSSELRLTEKWTSSAKSVFQFDVQGSVAKSTHAGLPWLLRIQQAVGDAIHFWPFDGWQIPGDKSVLAEVYPSIFRNRYERDDRTPDQQDAYCVARWLAVMDKRGRLPRYFEPPLTDAERAVAQLEGWILGIG